MFRKTSTMLKRNGAATWEKVRTLQGSLLATLAGVVLMLTTLAPAADACVEAWRYWPVAYGNSWEYEYAGIETVTFTFLNYKRNIGGVQTYISRPYTSVPGAITGDEFFTNDENGLILYGAEAMGVEVIFNPPILLMPACPELPWTNSQSGTVELLGYTFDYSVTASLQYWGTQTVPAGTFNETVQLVLTTRIWGCVLGECIDETETDSYWLAEDWGGIRATLEPPGDYIDLQLIGFSPGAYPDLASWIDGLTPPPACLTGEASETVPASVAVAVRNFGPGYVGASASKAEISLHRAGGGPVVWSTRCGPESLSEFQTGYCGVDGVISCGSPGDYFFEVCADPDDVLGEGDESNNCASTDVFPVAVLGCDGLGGDVDGDGVCGNTDNCSYRANADQADANGDGIGNVCQCADMNGDGFVNGADLTLYIRHFGGHASPFSTDRCGVSPAPDGGACDGADLTIIKRRFGGLPPGLTNTCSAYVGP